MREAFHTPGGQHRRLRYSVLLVSAAVGQPAYSKCHGSGSDPPAAAQDGWNHP